MTDNAERPGVTDNAERPGVTDNAERPGVTDYTERKSVTDDMERKGVTAILPLDGVWPRGNSGRWTVPEAMVVGGRRLLPREAAADLYCLAIPPGRTGR